MHRYILIIKLNVHTYVYIYMIHTKYKICISIHKHLYILPSIAYDTCPHAWRHIDIYWSTCILYTNCKFWWIYIFLNIPKLYIKLDHFFWYSSNCILYQIWNTYGYTYYILRNTKYIFCNEKYLYKKIILIFSLS